MHPVITIFCPFTRSWAVERWLESLGKMPHNPALTNLCFIIDSYERHMDDQLRAYSQQNGYRSYSSIVNEEWAPNEVRIADRRIRIAKVKEQSKDLIAKTDAEFIIGLEDDTVFDDLDIMRLIKPLQERKDVGFVEGVQIGRWGVRMVGAWEIDDVEYPQHCETMLPPPPESQGYEDISGGGFYGYATTKQLYLDHDYYTGPGQPWGPDVNFGLWLQVQGIQCLVDWTQPFGHNDHGSIAYPSTYPLEKVVYNRNTTNGKWEKMQ